MAVEDAEGERNRSVGTAAKTGGSHISREPLAVRHQEGVRTFPLGSSPTASDSSSNLIEPSQQTWQVAAAHLNKGALTSWLTHFSSAASDPLQKSEIPDRKHEILRQIYEILRWKPEILLWISMLPGQKPEIPGWIY
jgi:hypothetical protein